jgi:hypothetical protein
MLTDLLAAAMLKSTCAEAKCRVSAEVHKWFAYVVHLDEHAHVCPGCDWGDGYPRYFVSNETLYMSDRELLVKHISQWLCHLHAQPAGPAGLDGADGGGSAPIDADAPAHAPGSGSAGLSGNDGGLSDDCAGDRVSSARAD